MLVQASGGVRGEGNASHVQRELPQVIRPEPLEGHARASPIDQAPENISEVGVGRVTNGDHRQDPVVDETSQREGERPQRRGVGPMGVVDDKDHDAIVLRPAENVEQARSNGEGIQGETPPPQFPSQLSADLTRGSEELAEDTVRKATLGLVTISSEERDLLGRRQKALQECGLAEPGPALDQHGCRAPRTNRRQEIAKERELGSSSHENLVHRPPGLVGSDEKTRDFPEGEPAPSPLTSGAVTMASSERTSMRHRPLVLSATRAGNERSEMRTKISRRWGAAGAVAAMALLAAACGGGDDTREVTAKDYAFQNLPRSVDAGTTLTLKNASTKELHEMVVLRIPDGEKRSVQELINLPESEQEALFGAGPPAMVLLAPPNGGETIKAVGDGKLTEKGRYAVVCFIPTGVDPEAYLAASEAATDGPPEIPGAGPPHAFQGMYGEITVK